MFQSLELLEQFVAKDINLPFGRVWICDDIGVGDNLVFDVNRNGMLISAKLCKEISWGRPKAIIVVRFSRTMTSADLQCRG